MPEKSDRWPMALNSIQAVSGIYCAIFATWSYYHPLLPVGPKEIQLSASGTRLPAALFIGILVLALSVAAPAIITLISRLRPTKGASATPKTSRLKILNAHYAAINNQGTGYNVTECLEKMICGDSLVLQIENGNFRAGDHNYVPQDPLFGVMKLLHVSYSFDGVKAWAKRPEGTRMVLPEDTFMASAVAGVPLIPFQQIQLEAFAIVKEMRDFVTAFDPIPPMDLSLTEVAKFARIHERGKWRERLRADYRLRFEDRQKRLILQFQAKGISPYYSENPGVRTIEREIDSDAISLIVMAHRLDGIDLKAA